MNPSLQRYVEFRQMMVRQAHAQRAATRNKAVDGTGKDARLARERAVIDRSAMLERAAEQAEAMRWALHALRRHGGDRGALA